LIFEGCSKEYEIMWREEAKDMGSERNIFPIFLSELSFRTSLPVHIGT
jgi:hypothetical protein